MKYHEQIEIVSATARYLSQAMYDYRDAIRSWHLIENDRLPTNYTHAQYEIYQRERSALFNNTQYTMHEARRYHNLYMVEESKLNQMGRMKCT